ncbi:hypothetical protein ACFQDG_14725 [Natronoarchaeum mannanilyticum]|uniref:Uncharacterized protein n=1 Tax=Natronoarchaeum mannanilyticum TaxID=926360 RepID=A0AAV3TB43_9EURY
MDRRDLLAALGCGTATLAGCLGDAGSPAVPAENESPNSSASPGSCDVPEAADERSESTTGEVDGDVQRRITLAAVDEVPEGSDVRIDVEMLRSAMTAEKPARIRITTTNLGPTRAISVGDEDCKLFNYGASLSDAPAGLVLQDPSSIEYTERKDGRWVRDLTPDENVDFAPVGCDPTTYSCGESVSSEYVVWDDFRVAGYFEPGTYRWEDNVTVERAPDAGADDRTNWSWGFSIRVETPGE